MAETSLTEMIFVNFLLKKNKSQFMGLFNFLNSVFAQKNEAKKKISDLLKFKMTTLFVNSGFRKRWQIDWDLYDLNVTWRFEGQLLFNDHASNGFYKYNVNLSIIWIVDIVQNDRTWDLLYILLNFRNRCKSFYKGSWIHD